MAFGRPQQKIKLKMKYTCTQYYEYRINDIYSNIKHLNVIHVGSPVKLYLITPIGTRITASEVNYNGAHTDWRWRGSYDPGDG
jgi:hypothetical protein